MINITFLNNDGGGFSETFSVAADSTISDLFKVKMGGVSPSGYRIRVNRQPVEASYILQDGDKVSVTPTKIDGNGFFGSDIPDEDDDDFDTPEIPATPDKISIRFLNNDGGGFSESLTVAAGISIVDLFKIKMGGASPSGYRIRVNRQPVESSYILQDGDSVTVTPAKIDGN